MEKDFISYLEEKLNIQILAIDQLYGGCVNQSFKLTSKSQNYFIKINKDLDLFSTEVRGLDKLNSTNTFYIPEVIEHSRFKSDYYLVMDFIDSTKKKNNFWEIFGEKLASLHRNSGIKFGLKYDNYLGPLAQENTLHIDFIDFFINNRILPQLRMLEDKLSVNLYSNFNKLFKLLPDILPSQEPALLHGDLWSGNYLVDHIGEPVLIDPSIYYGCREVDIAMTKLFGGFPQDFYVAYNAAFPLMNEWEKRLDIWNLYPLLVHANLFGAAYLGQIYSILKGFRC